MLRSPHAESKSVNCDLGSFASGFPRGGGGVILNFLGFWWRRYGEEKRGGEEDDFV